MNKVILVMIIVVVLVISLLGSQQNQMDQDKTAIRQAALEDRDEGGLTASEMDTAGYVRERLFPIARSLVDVRSVLWAAGLPEYF